MEEKPCLGYSDNYTNGLLTLQQAPSRSLSTYKGTLQHQEQGSSFLLHHQKPDQKTRWANKPEALPSGAVDFSVEHQNVSQVHKNQNKPFLRGAGQTQSSQESFLNSTAASQGC